MEKICDIMKCTGCGLCSVVCPKKCIKLVSNKEGFRYPQIDSSQCVDCKLCSKKCPVNHSVTFNEPIEVYAGWSKDEEIRKESSSGGIFTEIANYVLKKDGYICGVVLDMPELKLHHIVSNTENDLKRMRGSKYFQSDSTEAFVEIKNKLKENKLVLYTGTGCQVAALLNYLNEADTTNLITVDVLCHGVTSGKVVRQYLKSREKRVGSCVSDLIFRSKEFGYGGVCLKVSFFKDKPYYGKSIEDAFMKAFNNNICLRQSCYKCQYAGERRISDITIADFWGIGEIEPFPQRTDGGTSCIIVNTKKGNNIISELQTDLNLYRRSLVEAQRKNQSLSKPMTYTKKRNVFFEKLDSEDFDDLVFKLIRFHEFGKKVKLLKQRVSKKLLRVFGVKK